MTLKDFLNRVNVQEDSDKMMIFKDVEGGWSNIDIKVTEQDIEVTCDCSSPFSDGG